MEDEDEEGRGQMDRIHEDGFAIVSELIAVVVVVLS